MSDNWSIEERRRNESITAFANYYGRSGALVAPFSKQQGCPTAAARGPALAGPPQFKCPACLKTSTIDASASMVMLYKYNRWLLCGDCSLSVRINGRHEHRIAMRAARNIDQVRV